MLCCFGSAGKGRRPKISRPANFEHRVHTEWNGDMRQYQGLPPQWKSLINQGPRPRPIVEGPSLTDHETLRILAELPPIHPEDDEVAGVQVQADAVILPGAKSPPTNGGVQAASRQFPASSHAEGSHEEQSPARRTGDSPPRAQQPVTVRAAPGRADSERDRRSTAISHEEFRSALAKIVNSDGQRQHYDNFVRVGEGSTGVVCTAKDLINRRTVAIKKMDLRKQQRRELLFNEVNPKKNFN